MGSEEGHCRGSEMGPQPFLTFFSNIYANLPSSLRARPGTLLAVPLGRHERASSNNGGDDLSQPLLSRSPPVPNCSTSPSSAPQVGGRGGSFRIGYFSSPCRPLLRVVPLRPRPCPTAPPCSSCAQLFPGLRTLAPLFLRFSTSSHFLITPPPSYFFP